MNLFAIATQYLDWGFTPLPVRDFLKYPAHLRIRDKSYSELRALAEATQSWDSATGVWLLLAEPAREDEYIHVAVDLDELPALSSLPPSAQRLFRDYALSTFAYWTARGAHFHFLVPRSEVPLQKRYCEIFGEGGRHVADLFIFAPSGDLSFSDSWRRGVLAYPSAAKDTHSDSENPPIVERKLIGAELKPPLKIRWADLVAFLRAIYGDVYFGRKMKHANIGSVRSVARKDIYLAGAPLRVSDAAAHALRALSRYPCANAVTPQVNAQGEIFARSPLAIPKGSRNNALFAILSLYNYINGGKSRVDVLEEIARAVNYYTFEEPLSDAEVTRVVTSVASGYVIRPATFAERFGLTSFCDTCPLKQVCKGEDDLFVPDVPDEKPIPADGDPWFAKRAFRSAQQLQMYKELLSKIQDPSVRIVLGIAPTGSGKTVHAASIAKFVVDKWNTTTVILVPTKQLQHQHEATLAAHDKGSPPFVVFKGRRNFRCPFLDLVVAAAISKGDLPPNFDRTRLTADIAPCAFGTTCIAAAAALRKANIGKMDGAVSEDAQRTLTSFDSALTLSLSDFVDSTDSLRLLKDIAKDVLDRVADIGGDLRCEYHEMLQRVLKFSSGVLPGVIVANKSLTWVIDRVSKMHTEGKTPVVIVDEAHELLDALIRKFEIRLLSEMNCSFANWADATAADLIVREAELVSKQMAQVRDNIAGAESKGDVKALRQLRRRLRFLQKYQNELKTYFDIVSSFPDAFVPFVDPVKRKVYIYPLANYRAKILRAYLTSTFPNLRFVLLTATGTHLIPAADVVVRAEDVIPVKNRMIIYEPIRSLSASAVGTRLESVYVHDVVPYIISRYAFFAPRIASAAGVDRVRAIVHESRKERAILIADELSKAGYTLVLYAGNRKDWKDIQLFADRAQRVLEDTNVHVVYSLEDAVSVFKKEKGYDFLVSVALGTGHDFDDPDVALQFIVKVPYPQVNDTEYQLIEVKDGEDARRKQYIWDTLMALIQAAGRTTRKPDQLSVTLVLDRSFERLLAAAWDYGFREEAIDLAKRIWCPQTEEERIRRVLPPELASVVLTPPTQF